MSDQVVTITGTPGAVDPDEVVLVIGDQDWIGWTSVRITRGIERVPNDFEFTLTELYPGDAHRLVAHAGDECKIYIGRNLVLTGYIDRVMPHIAPGVHEVTISGRGACQDLVDCAAEWPGSVIVAASVLDVARKLAAPFGITVNGEAGPAVGSGRDGALIPYLVLYLGETAWEIIERLCRIAGLLPYEMTDGSLLIAVNPGDDIERAIQKMAGVVSASSSSGFSEGVNVKHASATYAADQRYSNYRVHYYSLQRARDVNGEGANLIVEFKDQGVKRYRPRVIIAEMDKPFGPQNAFDRGAWEAVRNYGRAHVISLTTDSWRDSAGKIYAPNTLAPLDLPSLKAEGLVWLIGQVTYRKSAAGTECDLVLMPPEAFSVQPTLPVNTLPPDLLR